MDDDEAVPARRSSKRIYLVLLGAVVIAGLVIGMALRHRHRAGQVGLGGGVGSKEELARLAFAALEAGDVDELLRLSDPVGLEARSYDCHMTDRMRDRLYEQSRGSPRSQIEKLAGRRVKVLSVTDAGVQIRMEQGSTSFQGCRYTATVVGHDLAVELAVTDTDGTVANRTGAIGAFETGGVWFLRTTGDVELGRQ